MQIVEIGDKIMLFNKKGIIKGKIKLPRGGFIAMAVSLKPAPVIKGEAAKKITASYEKPVNNSEVLKKCQSAKKIFVTK